MALIAMLTVSVLGATGEAALIGYRQGRSAAPQRGFPRRLLDANDGGATDVFSIFGFPLLGKGADGWGQAAAPAAPAQQLQAPAPAAPEPAGGKPLFTVNWGPTPDDGVKPLRAPSNLGMGWMGYTSYRGNGGRHSAGARGH